MNPSQYGFVYKRAMNIRGSMTRIAPAALAAAALAVLDGQAQGQPSPDDVNQAPAPAAGCDWRDAARRHGLSERDLQALARDKVLVGSETFRQVFTPYIASSLPPFITSDSLLNAFHVLLEESVYRLELANAQQLPDVLKVLWSGLPEAGSGVRGRKDLMAAARTRARIVLGTALRLLGDEAVKPDDTAAAIIDAEAKKVTEAQALEKPPWLGPPANDLLEIDYSRYAPRGFYARSETLQRYFRAVSWLQSIPFRISRDDELLAILLLADALAARPQRPPSPSPEDVRGFFRRFTEWIGAGDDWDLWTAREIAGEKLQLDLDGGALGAIRGTLIERAGRPGMAALVNDQVRWPPAARHSAAEPQFRILSAYRTPDAVLFHRTTDIREFPGRQLALPSGLDLCAALGSGFARGRIAGAERDKLLKTIDEIKPFLIGSTFYQEYLNCLAALLDKPEPDVPAFMSGEPWVIKSCQTVLGGWAQLRHTWALHAKEARTIYAAGSPMPCGFVEPEPEFFSRMAQLIENTETQHKRAGALTVDRHRLAEDLRALASLIRKKGVIRMASEPVKSLSDAEQRLLERHRDLMQRALEQEPAEASPAFIADELTHLADEIGRAHV